MNRIIRNLADAARRRWRVSRVRRRDVLFYASSWIDEAWVRSTLLEAAQRKMNVALAVSGPPSERSRALLQKYSAHGVPVHSPIGADELSELRADLVVSATNGLRRASFHRSVRHMVHMPHSIVSLHMIYPPDSIDGFDTLFACGPHHVAEFERLSALRELLQRRVTPVGYGKLDVLTADTAVNPRHVLIAPSWGSKNILNTVGTDLVEGLLSSGFAVTVRPHPLFVLDRDAAWLELRERFAGRSGFAAEDPFDGDGAIRVAGVVVTDYSGVAFEYSALHGRRCVFVDVAKKVVNPAWEEVGLAPVEVALRPELGLVAAADCAQVLAAIQECAREAGPTTRVVATRSKFLFNQGACGRAAVDTLRAMLIAERAA